MIAHAIQFQFLRVDDVSRFGGVVGGHPANTTMANDDWFLTGVQDERSERKLCAMNANGVFETNSAMGTVVRVERTCHDLASALCSKVPNGTRLCPKRLVCVSPSASSGSALGNHAVLPASLAEISSHFGRDLVKMEKTFCT